MILFIIIFIFELLLIASFEVSVDIETVSNYFIVLNSLILVFLIAFYEKFISKVKLILIVSLVFRVALLFFDIYGRDIMYLPHSGADTEVFHAQARLFSEGLLQMKQLSRGIYAQFLGLIYNMTGPIRMLMQFFNIYLSLLALKYFYKTLLLLNVNYKLIISLMTLAAFFPQNMILSAILLRESIIFSFLSISLYHFVKYLKYGQNKSLFIALITSIIATIFHSGVITFPFLYILFSSIYYPRYKSVKINFQSSIIIVVGIIGFIAVVFAFPDLLMDKFSNIENEESLLKVVNYKQESAGSSYLTWINVDSSQQILLFSPLKMFYFLFSPMPWDIRGVSDFIAITLDSFLYLYIFIYIIKHRKYISKHHNRFMYYLNRFLLFIIILTTFLFSYGTIASGTAIRHRSKFVFALLLLYAIYKQSYLTYIKFKRNNKDNK